LRENRVRSGFRGGVLAWDVQRKKKRTPTKREDGGNTRKGEGKEKGGLKVAGVQKKMPTQVPHTYKEGEPKKKKKVVRQGLEGREGTEVVSARTYIEHSAKR